MSQICPVMDNVCTLSLKCSPLRRSKLKFINRRKIYNFCVVSQSKSSLNFGKIGPDRFSTIAGTYHAPPPEKEGSVVVEVSGMEVSGMEVRAEAGENLLRVVQRAGLLGAQMPLCFEGTCRLCEVHVTGGAKEAPLRGDAEEGEMVRSCMAGVPAGLARVKVCLMEDFQEEDEERSSVTQIDEEDEEDFFV